MRTGWLEDRPHPIVAASMAGASGPRLASAVTAAGGLGTLAFAYRTTPETVEQECAATTGPFGIGLMSWLVVDQPGVLEAAVAARPTVLSLSFGDPATTVPRARELDPDLPLVSQVGTLDEARRALEVGVDALVARGSEGGGHGRGEVATMPLLQQVLEVAEDVPVLAAGGIATGRGVAAALAAGAVGVWVGTPFAACRESVLPDPLKAAVVAADATGTTYTRAFDVAQRLGWPVELGGRALSNDFTAEWGDRVEELAAVVAADDTITDLMAEARASGRTETAPVYAGQSAGLVPAVRSAAEVVAELATYREHLAVAAQRWLSS